MALTITAILLASCAGDGGDPEDNGSASPNVEPSSPEAREEIRIETKVTIPTGEVLAGSVIGDLPFCAGGTFRDDEGNAEVGAATVLRTFSCPEGELKVGFSPGPEAELTQTGPWYILRDSGSGSFEGLRGNGLMTAKFEQANESEGRETFTGKVTR